jgi:hypothetical protein
VQVGDCFIHTHVFFWVSSEAYRQGRPNFIRIRRNASGDHRLSDMRGTLEFHAEARRLRNAFRRLTASPASARIGHAENPDIRNNVEHCRALLLRGIEEEPQRRVIEQLLRYMEKSIAEIAGIEASHRQHDGFETSPGLAERRLKIVARELLRGEGLRTVSYLRELADIANSAGDQPSAAAWQELADAAERIIHLVQGVRGDRSASVEAFDRRTSSRTKPSW